MSPFDRPPVDTVRERSVSFAPPSPGPAAGIRLGVHQLPVSEALGRPAIVAPTLVRGSERDEVNGYPIQLAKVQRPPLRDETLARERLLDWLGVKIHHRVVFVTAEAGYGKTTLLSDFSRRSRLRTLWYRLDDEDRNWVAFLSYLVAAGREYDPTFAEVTSGLLGELGTGGPTRESVTETFVREFRTLGDQGAVLVFDDYHVVDDSADVRYVVGELLARAPERITFVFSSRRQPSVRVARLRALGELAELTTDDLRFSEPETERLFRDIYHHPLEPDVLDDLSRRTEGWAASLQLVRAAIRDRSTGDVRRFVRSLSGAEGDLHDYLAEEVIGDLDPDLQDFVMKTSVLQSVAPTEAQAVTLAPEAAAREFSIRAEQLGLLHRRGEGSATVQRFHPLVREFLEQRLRRSVGDEGIRELHRRVARVAEARDDWKVACYHYSSAEESAPLQRVLAGAIHTIMGGGEYALAGSYLDRHPPQRDEPSFDIVRSRLHFRRGEINAAVDRASDAVRGDPASDEALANLASLQFMAGNIEVATNLAHQLAARTPDKMLRGIASATVGLARSSIDGELPPIVPHLEALASLQSSARHYHFQGISLLNCATTMRAMGEAEAALPMASQAVELLEASSDGSEVAAARVIRAWALAHLNRWDDARTDLDDFDRIPFASMRVECLAESALIHAMYGDPSRGQEVLQEGVGLLGHGTDVDDQWHVAAAELAVRRGRLEDAADMVNSFAPVAPSAEPGHQAHKLTVVAHVRMARGESSNEALSEASRLAEGQGATFYLEQCRLLGAFAAGPSAWDRRVASTLHESPVYLTILADMVSKRVHDLGVTTLALLQLEVVKRPTPWRHALRLVVDDPGSKSRIIAANLLESVGTIQDVPRLRSVARSMRGSEQLGKSLARRLAPRIRVEDQGRVSVVRGEEIIAGTTVRRKVLAALCFLISRPGFSATRDQVLDALWPDMSPDVATNSLNQTIYFLRRLFEPGYKEDHSPQYVHHNSDLVWLDGELVSSRSNECWGIIRQMAPEPAPGDVEALSDAYRGRFALDFFYEEWAVPYRDALHAAYLQVIENAVLADTGSGYFLRGVRIARRAIEVDPEADQIELALLRLYRLSGSHAAAAEQYGHYAAMVRRELGVDPPPLDSL